VGKSQIADKFAGKLEPVPDLFNPQLELNGFDQPQTPIVSKDAPNKLQLFQWGYKASWMKAPLLNARFETVEEKKSFAPFIENRCLILVDGFYEWQWLDAKGKKKQKYLMHLPKHEPFFLAGQFQEKVDRESGEILSNYVIYTLEAEGVMKEIHNSKMRMPLAFSSLEAGWGFLETAEVKSFSTFETQAIPSGIGPSEHSAQGSLF